MRVNPIRSLGSHLSESCPCIKKFISFVASGAIEELRRRYQDCAEVSGNRVVWMQKADLVKNKQQDHLQKLVLLAEAGQWEHLQMHTTHPDSGFDWWMFPVDRASSGYGDQYRVSKSDVEILMKDPAFMKNYRDGVILVAKSWGWDLENRKDLSNGVQKWTNYQVRLGKMLDSLKLFRQEDLRIVLADFIHQKGIYSSLEPWIKLLLYTRSS